jgi:hypothetical protein
MVQDGKTFGANNTMPTGEERSARITQRRKQNIGKCANDTADVGEK